jgi:uncharacterized protein YqjF (DUF2071 family)
MLDTLINNKRTETLSDAARERMLAVRGEPLFYADWVPAMFIHYEVDAEVLQRAVPFELDLDGGRAYVSLVAFTMRGMRPRSGGRLTEFLFRPIATHEFLNVRTYVKHGGETGIYFLAEWLSNRLSVKLGPPLFGLPYRHGKSNHNHDHEHGTLHGVVTGSENGARLEYQAEIDPDASFLPCVSGSRDEFLMERYTAFTKGTSHRRFFRIWHPPWPQVLVQIKMLDESLLVGAWPWFKTARLVGANY